jgi:hypothetical protein
MRGALAHGQSQLLLSIAVGIACCSPCTFGFISALVPGNSPLARLDCRGRCTAARRVSPAMIIDRVRRV